MTVGGNSLLIDAIGAPASYKSKTMIDLTSWLKSYFSYYSLPTTVEYCQEYVKAAIWEGDKYTVGNQALVFGEQYRSVERLINSGVNIICSDSALMLSANYACPNKYPKEQFVDIIRAHYSNLKAKILPIYFSPNKNRHYQQEGRRENKEESDRKDREIYETAKEIFGDRMITVEGNNKAVFKIMRYLLEEKLLTGSVNNLKEFVNKYIEENLE